MTIATEVTAFCQDNSKMAWILLGVLALLFLVYIYMPCVFDFFSWENLYCVFQKIWEWLNKAWDSLAGAVNGAFSSSDCDESSDDCECRHFEQGCDDDSTNGIGSGSSSSGVGHVTGEGNIIVNLPAINVTVNGTTTEPNGGTGTSPIPLPPIVIPPITIPPMYPQIPYDGSNMGCSSSGNSGITDCEVIDSVNLCGKKYAITYMQGQIRVYDSSGSNIIQTLTHNLGLLRSIRYENDKFVVEDSRSHEYAGVITNGAINFVPYP